MSPTKKSSKKRQPLPDRVDFQTWKQNVARFLSIKSPAGEAFLCWLQKKRDFAVHIGAQEDAEIDSLLATAYNMTRPQLGSLAEKARHDYAALKIREILPALEDTIRAMKATNSQLVPEDGIPPLNLSSFQRHLENAESEAKGILLFLDRPNMREADALNHCIMFLSQLHEYRVPEADALALGRVLMRAHGFSDDDLGDFSKRSVDSGKARKRRSNYVSNWFNTALTALEMHQKHSKQTPFDRTPYKPKSK